MIRWTSRLALANEVENLPRSRKAVYDCIRDWDPATRGAGPSIEDIAGETGMKEHSVSGRVNELKKAGAVAEGPLKTNLSGKQAMTYIAIGFREPVFACSADGQGELFTS